MPLHIPNFSARQATLAPEHVAIVKRLVGEKGVSPVARLLKCTPHLVQEIATGGRMRKVTADRLTKALETNVIGAGVL